MNTVAAHAPDPEPSAGRGPGRARGGDAEHRAAGCVEGARGGSIAPQDAETRAAIGEPRRIPGEEVDRGAAASARKGALRVPGRSGPPGWPRTDLTPGDPLVDGGRVRAVIDFGCAGVGNPARDPLPARNPLPPVARGSSARHSPWTTRPGSAVGAGTLAGPDRAAVPPEDELRDGARRPAGDPGGAGRRPNRPPACRGSPVPTTRRRLR
ncbi:phosphotransferase [Streptomyces sp. Act-28]